MDPLCLYLDHMNGIVWYTYAKKTQILTYTFLKVVPSEFYKGFNNNGKVKIILWYVSCCVVHRLHEFIWHGSDIADPAHWTPRANKFTKLPHVPSQFYYNVSHHMFMYMFFMVLCR